MSTIRNWYIYLVSALTASVMAWAAISLLRDLTVVESSPPLAIASKVAALIVALPIFVIHARWAQRVAASEETERPGFVSRLYLTGMAASYLGVTLTYTYDALSALLRWLFGVGDGGVYVGYGEPELVNGAAVLYYLIPAIIGAFVWLLHRQRIMQMIRRTKASSQHVTDGTTDDVLLRLAQSVFSVVGLAVFVAGVAQLLTILLRLLANVADSAESNLIIAAILPEIARIAIGLSLWLIFQRNARQRTAARPEPAPQLWPWTQMLSGLALFIAAFIGFGTVLWSLLQLLFDLEQWPDIHGRLLAAAAMLIVCAVLWVYHNTLLRAPVQVEVASALTDAMRFYRYIVAGIGLTTFLGGTVGLITMLIREFAGATTSRTQNLEIVAWTIAAIIAGLPTWVLPWLALQREAAGEESSEGDARTSRVRQFYLYFFLFVAVMTILGSAIYILTQLVGVLLGEPLTSVSAEMAQAIAYSLIAGLILTYHWRIVAADRKFALTMEAKQAQTLIIAVLNDETNRLGSTLVPLLRQHLAKAKIEVLDLGDEAFSATIASASFIIAPSSLAPEIIESSAQKLFIPTWSQDSHWVGVEQLDAEQQAKAVANSIRQLLVGKPVRPARRFGCWSLVGVIVLLIVFMQLVGMIASLSFVG